MAEVNFKTWKVTIYDSMKGAFRRFGEGGQFNAFAKNLKKILDTTSYWDHFPKEKRRNDIMSFVEGENVPQQTGPLGDCGIFLCMFMEKLASGLPLTLDKDAQQAAVAFRYRMARIFLVSR